MPVITKGDPIRQNQYTSGGVIKIGDFVMFNSAGQVVVAAASNALLGVSNSYASASGLAVTVWDHPDQMYIAQSSTADIDALTDFNLNYNIVANTTSGAEGNHTILGSSGATDSILPLKLLSLSPEAFAALGSTNTRCVCIINNHQLKGGTGTLGV